MKLSGLKITVLALALSASLPGCSSLPISHKSRTNVNLNQVSSSLKIAFPPSATVLQAELSQERLFFTPSAQYQNLWAKISLDNSDLDAFQTTVEKRAGKKLETPFHMTRFGSEHDALHTYPTWWEPPETQTTTGLHDKAGAGFYEVQISPADNAKSIIYIQWFPD